MIKTFGPLKLRWRWLRFRYDYGRYHYDRLENGILWDKWWEWVL